MLQGLQVLTRPQSRNKCTKEVVDLYPFLKDG